MTDTQTPTLLGMTIAVLLMAQVRPDSKQMVPKQASLRMLNGGVIIAETEPGLKLGVVKSSADEVPEGQKWQPSLVGSHCVTVAQSALTWSSQDGQGAKHNQHQLSLPLPCPFCFHCC